MPNRHTSSVLGRIRKVAAAQLAWDLPDRDLLEAFVARRDEAGFAALVRRHGPMVLGLCRRILGNEQDAEDAFQATFLVLSRQANSLRPERSLVGWLYRVASRTAQKARVAAARRRRHERLCPGRQVDDPLAQLTLREGYEIVDRELARMPDRLRVPLVLCYLEGLTRDEAAGRLGCLPGTLKSRLEQAREFLRARLASRGLTLSGPLVASLFCGGTAPAAVRVALLDSTVKAAMSVAAYPAAASAVPAGVAALTEGVRRAMFANKLKPFAATLLGCLAVGGVALLTFRAAAAGRGDSPGAAQAPLSVGTRAPSGQARTAAPPADKDADDAKKVDQARAGLKERCRKIHELQAAVYEDTKRLHKAIEGNKGKRPGPEDRQARARLAGKQKEVIAEVTRAIDQLKTDGLAVALPEVLRQMRDDMKYVQRRLENGNVGIATQALMGEALDTLKQMIAALQQ